MMEDHEEEKQKLQQENEALKEETERLREELENEKHSQQQHKDMKISIQEEIEDLQYQFYLQKEFKLIFEGGKSKIKVR